MKQVLYISIVLFLTTIQILGQNPKEVILLGTKNTSQTIEFNADEVNKLFNNKSKGNLSLLSTAFINKGVTCCSPAKKLSKCIWSCCDGKTINTCATSSEMQEAVDLYFISIKDSTKKAKPHENHR